MKKSVDGDKVDFIVNDINGLMNGQGAHSGNVQINVVSADPAVAQRYAGAIRQGLGHRRNQTSVGVGSYDPLGLGQRYSTQYLTTENVGPAARLTQLVQGMLITIRLRDQPYISLGSYSKGPYQPGVVCLSMGCCSGSDWLVTDIDSDGAFTMRPSSQDFRANIPAYLAEHGGSLVLSHQPTWFVISEADEGGYVRIAPKHMPLAFISTVPYRHDNSNVGLTGDRTIKTQLILNEARRRFY